jgi:hypothetical protein
MDMFVIHLENSANEWELCKYVFPSYYDADEYAKEHFYMYEMYVIEQLEQY